MKQIKCIMILFIIIFITGCSVQTYEEKLEAENQFNNKLTISNPEVGKPPIIFENIKNAEVHYNYPYISFIKDGVEYEYKGDYLFETYKY